MTHVQDHRQCDQHHVRSNEKDDGYTEIAEKLDGPGPFIADKVF